MGGDCFCDAFAVLRHRRSLSSLFSPAAFYLTHLRSPSPSSRLLELRRLIVIVFPSLFLLTRRSPFVGFNKYPPLPGNENVPTPPETVEATRMGLYRAKCLPQVLDIIARARRMRKNHPLLRSIYLLTDAHGPWLDEVRMWLESEGWDHVWVGREDIYPRWREREVGVAVDMEVARRAGVFVGNGVSASERASEHESSAWSTTHPFLARLARASGWIRFGLDVVWLWVWLLLSLWLWLWLGTWFRL